MQQVSSIPRRRARVRWRSKITGREGHGEWISETAAQAEVDRARREGEDRIVHWIEREATVTVEQKYR